MSYIPSQTLEKLRMLERVFSEQYGLTVSFEQKAKELNKFGRKEDVGTSATTIASLGGALNETYLSSNGITHVSSEATGDNSKTGTYEYHTLAGSVFSFGAATWTLDASDGQTKTALPTAAARISRAYNTGSTNLTGPVHFYEDVAISAGKPTDTSKIHLSIPAGKNQSFKAATTISGVDVLGLTHLMAGVGKKTTATVDLTLEIRLFGQVFREQWPIFVATGGRSYTIFELPTPIPVLPNSDIRVQGIASTTNVDVVAGFGGWLGSVL